VRYLDWIPLMAWIGVDLLRQREFKRLILVLLGFGLLASCNLLYDKLLTGNALLPPAIDDARHYTGVQRLGASLGLSWHGFPVTGIRLLRTVYAFPPAVLVLLCLFRRCRSVQFKVCTVLCALGVSIYFLYAWTPAGPGPRYYFPYFPLLFLAVIEAYRLNRDWTVAQIGWPLALAALVICSSVYATDQTLEIYRRRDLERTVATLPETKKIILLETGTYKMEIPDLVRNPIDLWSADTLYFDYTDRAGLDDLLRPVAGEPQVFAAAGSAGPRRGRLVRAVVAQGDFFLMMMRQRDIAAWAAHDLAAGRTGGPPRPPRWRCGS